MCLLPISYSQTSRLNEPATLFGHRKICDGMSFKKNDENNCATFINTYSGEVESESHS